MAEKKKVWETKDPTKSDKKLTPAKLMNIYINNQDNEKQFLHELNELNESMLNEFSQAISD